MTNDHLPPIEKLTERESEVLQLVAAFAALLATLVVPRLDQPEWATATPTPALTPPRPSRFLEIQAP